MARCFPLKSKKISSSAFALFPWLVSAVWLDLLTLWGCFTRIISFCIISMIGFGSLAGFTHFVRMFYTYHQLLHYFHDWFRQFGWIYSLCEDVLHVSLGYETPPYKNILSFSIPFVLKCAAKLLKIGLQLKIQCPKMFFNRDFCIHWANCKQRKLLFSQKKSLDNLSAMHKTNPK